jgi:flagellar hook assembly protein FlgD/outer membrane protein OmpA-like peptidoglycan-associated protein
MFITAIAAVSGFTPLFAYDPPNGGDLLPGFYSPLFSAGGASVESTESPEADAINPAASGAAQLMQFDASYGALTAFGTDYGNIFNAGFTLPQPYGVWSGNIHFLNSPFASMPLGTVFTAKGSFSKELYPNLTVGLGIGLMLGAGTTLFDWGAGLDLGISQGLGDIAFMKDFRWGAAVTGIGKPFAADIPGASGTPNTGYPSPFTLTAGASFAAIKTEDMGLRVSLDLARPDLAAPTALNFIAQLGLSFSYRDIIGLSASWGINAYDISVGRLWQIPSFGLKAKIPLDTSDAAPGLGELRPTIAAQPFASGIWAFSGGMTAVIDKPDTTGPVITATWPGFEHEALYLSLGTGRPNDSLSVPVTITDHRFVTGYALLITDESGNLVRKISDEIPSPKNIFDRILFVKRGVTVPPELRWDGKTEPGVSVSDGVYSAVIEARDDNGNTSRTDPYVVKVRSTPPSASITPPADETDLIFSPDGDGNKDTFTVRMIGSKEDLWTGTFSDSVQAAVKKIEFKDSPPSDYAWDGMSDAGTVVADGIYSFVLSATDRAGNSIEQKLDEIVVNTQKPGVSLSIDTAWFSPTGEGAINTISFGLGVPVKAGIVSWKLSIADAAGSEKWSVSGKDGTNIEDKTVFDGRDESRKVLADGSYKATLAVRYVNGNSPVAISPVFHIKTTKPTAVVKVNYSAFSPNGDGNKDTVTYTQTTSEEDQWIGTISDVFTKQPVKTFTFTGKADSQLDWDGTDDSGRLAHDGTYVYVLTTSDRAGNAGSSAPVVVSLDTEKKNVILYMDKNAFSPNGDGVKDLITFNAQVQNPDQVTKYELQVRDDSGKTVKSWTGTMTPPQAYLWDGTTDSGDKTNDGQYQGKMTVTYLAGQVETAQAPQLLLRTVFPQIDVSTDKLLFCPTGESTKKTVTFTQSSMAGDDWKGTIVDSKGAAVKSYTWKSLAETFVWDGTDSSGNVVPDGQYGYVASSTDTAGNHVEKRVDGITVDTREMQVLLAASLPAFSPNGDGIKDTISLNAQVQRAAETADFALAILDAGGKTVKSWSGAVPASTVFLWDGIKDSKDPAGDATYSARLKVDYKSGRIETTQSAPFLLRAAFPKADISADTYLFCPTGESVRKTVTISQTSTPGDDWAGVFLDAKGKAVRNYSWKDSLLGFTWDGTDDSGSIAPDGAYTYVVGSEDIAGNRTEKKIEGITVDSRRMSVSLSASLPGFSPNGDGVKETLTLNAPIQSPAEVVDYALSILDASGAQTRGWSGKVPTAAVYVWDGLTDAKARAPDGQYAANIRVEYRSGRVETAALPSPLLLRVTFPKIDISANWLLFDPRPKSRRPGVTITQTSAPGDDWKGAVLDSKGNAVKRYSWKGSADTFVWYATDDSGAQVPDGTYSYMVSSEDGAGNRAEKRIEGIKVDSRPTEAAVMAGRAGFSPLGDGTAPDEPLTIVVTLRDGVTNWKLELIDSGGTAQRTFSGKDGAGIPRTLTWDGKSSSGAYAQSIYIAALTVEYEKGFTAYGASPTFKLATNPPQTNAGFSPQPFSPDGDGADDTLTISLSAVSPLQIRDWSFEIRESQVVESTNPAAKASDTQFIRYSGTGTPPAQLLWDGQSNKNELVQSATEYPYIYTVADIYGNTTKLTGSIQVDVLVMRDGDRLKIKVPSIVFRANAADFNGLGQDILDKNDWTIKRIAVILNKFKEYKVRIEGHGNNLSKISGTKKQIDDEETKELIPLSTNRAAMVRQKLIENGVDPARLTILGLGSSEPVVPIKDTQNLWKNRRVEFILIK